MSTAHKIINRLSGVRLVGHQRWVARCPAHDDRSPSLAVSDIDGRVLLHCFAGCETEDVLAAIGLRFSDLYPAPLGNFAPDRRRRFDAEQVLAAITHEVIVVVLVVSDLLETGKISSEDESRLQLAARRLNAGPDQIGAGVVPEEIKRIRRAEAMNQ